MKRVLNRAVLASDGVTYPEGTPVEKLPAEHHESLNSIHWSRPAPVDEPVAEPEQKPEAAVEAAQDESSESESPDPEQTPEVVEPEVSDDDSDETPLEDVGELKTEHRELLESAGVATVEQAKAYLANNKTFRTVSGIGKVGDQEIREALGL